MSITPQHTPITQLQYELSTFKMELAVGLLQTSGQCQQVISDHVNPKFTMTQRSFDAQVQFNSGNSCDWICPWAVVVEVKKLNFF